MTEKTTNIDTIEQSPSTNLHIVICQLELWIRSDIYTCNYRLCSYIQSLSNTRLYVQRIRLRLRNIINIIISYFPQ